MTTTVVEPVFLDTNILVYANIDPSPFHQVALEAIRAYEAAGTPLWISRQLTNNVADFAPFGHLITVIPLWPQP